MNKQEVLELLDQLLVGCYRTIRTELDTDILVVDYEKLRNNIIAEHQNPSGV